MDERVGQVFGWLLEGMTPQEIIRQAMSTFDVKGRMAHNYLKKARALIENDASEETRTFHLRHSMLIRERVLRTVLSTLENSERLDPRKMTAVSSLANTANRLLDGRDGAATDLDKNINRVASAAEFRAEVNAVMGKLRAEAPPMPQFETSETVPQRGNLRAEALPEPAPEPPDLSALWPDEPPDEPPGEAAPGDPPAVPTDFLDVPSEMYQVIMLDLNTPPGMEQMHQEAMARLKQQDRAMWELLQYAITCERWWRRCHAGEFAPDDDPPPRPRPVFRRPTPPTSSASATVENRPAGVHSGQPPRPPAMVNPNGGKEMRSAPPSWQPVQESAKQCTNPAPSVADRPAPGS
jgi:hypothetical protein